ncbi:hypothetical protein [Patiriisocius hiemis]|uniref:Uncharacterized protein n=1 Tax=Patiriisocius hiemis TaxID=3075604 RepID=A0ABU2YCV6_9FLAO|nr:hypothetical protein [Constantimarinum sp. W242]MDT0555645.1 hypothetical protein [Constantimarinum sp. W242]
MKKKLREDITQTAQKIIELDTNFDTKKVKNAVAILFEKLSVLAYLESQIEDSPEQLSQQASLDSKSFREENWFKEPEPVPQPEHKEDLIEPLMEKIKDIVAQMPEESRRVDELLEEVLPKKKYVKNDLEEFASNYQQTPTFTRKTEEPKRYTLKEKEPTKGGEVPKPSSSLIEEKKEMGGKPKSINDAVNNGLSIGLNDRLAFIKHLFDGKNEDYNRVLSQVSTMSNYEEAATFIKGKVKPDYNYWLDKEEFANRFMAIIEKSFN